MPRWIYSLLLMSAAPAVGWSQIPSLPRPLPLPLPMQPSVPIAEPAEAPSFSLPRDENLIAVTPRTLSVKRLNSSWQVWMDGKVFRDCGDNLDNANEISRVLRELAPTHWTSIGSDRHVVEYGLTTGETGKPEPPRIGGFPRLILPIDLRSVRMEMIRGVWCIRDDQSILLNFGPHRDDAAQAIGVIRKYGFNRIGKVGRPDVVMSYLFAAPQIDAAPQVALPEALANAARVMQERNLTRTGIEVPGLGYVGERITIDPRKVEVRRERGEYVLVHGPDVLARFSGNDWAARDAMRLIQDLRVNEFCRFGTQGVTFFLQNGVPPQRVPFFAQGNRFDPKNLKVRELASVWWVCDGTGRQVLPAGSNEEAEQLIQLIRAYGFDQVGQVGTSSRASLRFLAKAR